MVNQAGLIQQLNTRLELLEKEILELQQRPPLSTAPFGASRKNFPKTRKNPGKRKVVRELFANLRHRLKLLMFRLNIVLIVFLKLNISNITPKLLKNSPLLKSKLFKSTPKAVSVPSVKKKFVLRILGKFLKPKGRLQLRSVREP